MSILTVGVAGTRRIQLYQEAVAGTPGAATAIYRGGVAPGVEDQREITFVDENVGYVAGLDRTYIAKLLAAVSWDSHSLTFEQAPYTFEGGIHTVTPTQDGAGTDYIYPYVFGTNAQKTIKTFTMELGDNIQAQEIEHAYVVDYTISGEAGAAVMLASNWEGRQATDATFTNALTPPAVEEILASKGKLYIDAEGGTIGTTQMSDTLLSFELAVTTGWISVFTIDGQLYFTGIKWTQPEITLNLTFEHNAGSVIERQNWESQTPRLIRLIFEGSAVGTPGTTYTYKTFIIDVAGKWESFESLGENNGNDILTGSFRVRNNLTAGLFCEHTIVNEVTALP